MRCVIIYLITAVCAYFNKVSWIYLGSSLITPIAIIRHAAIQAQQQAEFHRHGLKMLPIYGGRGSLRGVVVNDTQTYTIFSREIFVRIYLQYS